MTRNPGKVNFLKKDVKRLQKSELKCCCGMKIQFSMFMSILVIIWFRPFSRAFENTPACQRVKKCKNGIENEDDSEDEQNIEIVEISRSRTVEGSATCQSVKKCENDTEDEVDNEDEQKIVNDDANSMETPLRAKTQLIRDTDSPGYNEKFLADIQPKVRHCQRVFKRQAIKF